jgi:hypothetical protein
MRWSVHNCGGQSNSPTEEQLSQRRVRESRAHDPGPNQQMVGRVYQKTRES